MGIVRDVALAIPLGITYNIFIHKLILLMLSDMPYDEKYQKSLVLLFIAGILGIVVAYLVFANSSYKNRAMRYGLNFGSSLLLFHTLITNWDKMQDDTKMILMGFMIFGLVWYCYSEESKPVKTKKIKKSEKIDKIKHKDI